MRFAKLVGLSLLSLTVAAAAQEAKDQEPACFAPTSSTQAPCLIAKCAVGPTPLLAGPSAMASLVWRPT